MTTIAQASKKLEHKQRLTQLYDKIPEVRCPDGCTKCCGPQQVTHTEAEAMGMGSDRTCTRWDDGYNCEFRTSLGCSIYKDRPLICRLYGAGKYYTPMGCRIREKTGMPDNGIDEAKQREITFEYFVIMVEQGVDTVDGEMLFALYEHDHKNGFITDEEFKDLHNNDPGILIKLAAWRKKEKEKKK